MRPPGSRTAWYVVAWGRALRVPLPGTSVRFEPSRTVVPPGPAVPSLMLSVPMLPPAADDEIVTFPTLDRRVNTRPSGTPAESVLEFE